MQVPDESREL